MCGSMVDIQSATTKNRRGKKKEEETSAAEYKDRLATTDHRTHQSRFMALFPGPPG